MNKYTTASEYIKHYHLKLNYDDFSREFTYEREITLKGKVIYLQVLEDESNETKCCLFIGTFYPNKYDSKAKCYGKFGQPKFIENLKNDIAQYELSKTGGKEKC